MLSDSIKNSILREIFSAYNKKNINTIVLIGSRAREDFNKNSDYDVEVYLKNIKLNFKSKMPSLPENNIFINYTDMQQFKDMVKKGHSFLYCSFRDGIPLYNKNNWFEKNKNRIIKLKPKKETIAFYLEAGLENLMRLSRREIFYLDYEDGKSAANQLGFAILMNNGIYPTSPHTLKDELIKLNKKYKKIAKIIFYIQEIYYKNKKPKGKTYIKNINNLKKFAIYYLKKNFPQNYKKIKQHEKLLNRLKV